MVPQGFHLQERLMGDRGGVSYAYSGETTEWEDILVKKGVVTREQVFGAKGLDAREFPEKGKEVVEEEEEESEADAKERALASASLEELDEAEDELDDDRALQHYRAKRMAELREKAAKERFGDVTEISKSDWVSEVTEASKSCWVVVHLYQDRVIECRLLEEVLVAAARKFRAVKFVKIVSTAAVENWPDRNLPTLFIYHDGELSTQLLGIKKLGGRSTNLKDLEWYLASIGIVETDMEENPRKEGTTVRRVGGGGSRGRGGSDDEDDDEGGYDSDR